MSAVAATETSRKMPTGSSRRKARVPLHITRQTIVEDVPAMGSEDEDDGEMETPFFDPDVPSTSGKRQLNGAGVDVVDAKTETNAVKEEPELPEGTVVVQPEAVPDNDSDFDGPEFKAKRSKRTAQKDAASDIDRVHCTSCNKQVNHHDLRTFKPHPALKVVICRKCFEYYKSGKFTQDEDGIDEQCRWCAEGGSLICCDFCSNAFCKKCIKRNLGRSTLTNLIDDEETKWHCFICDPSPLHQLQRIYKDVVRGVNASKPELPKSRRALLRDSSASTETSEVEENVELLHPSISNVTVNLRIKPNSPSLEINPEGLRISMPRGGDQHGLKMALWMMRSLRQTTEKAERAIKRRLAVKTDTAKAGKASGAAEPSDENKKWLVVKIGSGRPSKQSPSQHNGQTSQHSKNTKDLPVKKQVKKDDVKDTPPSTPDLNGDVDPEDDKQIKEDQDISKKSVSDQTSENMEVEEDEDDQSSDIPKEEASDDKEETMDTEQDSTKEGESTTDANDPADDEVKKQEETEAQEDASEGKEDDEEGENKDPEENAEDRSDKDIECEKALMEEIEGMMSDHSAEENETPKKETNPDRKHLMSITPLRIKLEKISPTKLDQSRKEKCKSPRRQKTTPRSSKSSSRKHSSDSSDNEAWETASDAGTGQSKGASKELFKAAEEDSDSLSSSEDSSSVEDTDWRTRRRKSKRHKSQDIKKSEDEKGLGKKTEKERKKKKDGDGSDSEIDFPKSADRNQRSCSSRGPGKDSSNLEDDSDEVERLITPRKSSSLRTRRSSRQKETPKNSTKSKLRSKTKVRESDSSNFDSDLERQINNLSKTPSKTRKDDKVEDSGPEGSGAPGESDAESSEEKSTGTKKTETSGPDLGSDSEQKTKTKGKKGRKTRSAKDTSDSSSDSGDGAQEGEAAEDDQLLETKSNEGETSVADGDALDSDLENKLAEQQLMEEIEAELDKEDGENEEETSDDDDDDSDSDQQRKTKGKKKKRAASGSGDNDDDFKASSGEEEDEDDESGDESSGMDGSSGDGKTSKKKKHGRRHHLMRVKLGETSSSNEDASDSDSKKKAKSKRGKKRGQASVGSTDSDSVKVKAKKGKGRSRKRSSSGSDRSSADFQKGRSYNRGKGKGKKRRRIKVVSESDSGEAKRKGSESSDDEKDTPSKHGRKKIRKLISKNKLQDETVRAAKEEKERRKRIAEKRQKVTEVSEEAAEKMGTVDEIILERDSKSKEIILSVEDSLAKQLKPHQVEGVQFMWDCTFESMEKIKEKGSGCILAHCMGLGKTLQVITFLHTVMNNDKINMKHCLVVAPLNTVLNWVAEFEKWLGEDSDIEVLEITSYKNNWQRADALKHWHENGGVMVMGYSMYRQLSMHKFVKNKKQRAIFTKALVDPGPEIVVCDEGHMLKNNASAISKALNSIATRRRICLTGTPLQNNLVEYHCMVDFVKPNLLGTRKEFLNRFVNPITNGQCADSTAKDVKVMKRRAHVLHDLLNGCVQRKDYSALTKFLPPKHEYVISVRLTSVQIKLYELYLQSQSRNDSGELMEGSSKGSGAGLFADYQQLMQIWTHPHVLKLSEIRQEKIQSRNYMSDFVTSASESEISDSNDSIQQFVADGSDPEEIVIDEDEDMPSTSTGVRGTRRTRRMALQESLRQEKEGGSKKASKGSGDSDSSMEIIKTWKTRSRRRGSGSEDGTRSPSPCLQVAKPKWYDEYLQEGDDTKIELSGKLVLLFEVLKHAESIGEKVLVFSQSLLSLDLIEDMLQSLEDRAQVEREEGSQDLTNQIGGVGSWVKGEDYFRMDGSTSAQFRKTWAETFNDMKNYRARLFLISTKAGSLGTNLIGANRVIIFDASWNPSHDIQSIFRVYRFGQSRAVYIYRFVAQGTMEEKIYERQVTKQSLSCRVVDEHQIERHFTSADLSDLYTFTPERLDDPNRPERETPVLPKDYVLAEMLKHEDKWIVKYHEHDSLLENIESEELNEEERQNAWKEYEDEKEGRIRMGFDPRLLANQGMNQQELARLQGIYGPQAALQMAQLLNNQPQRQQSYSVLPNMISGTGLNTSTMMQQLAMSAANPTDHYQMMIYRHAQQVEQAKQLQQLFQKQKQQQQQQQLYKTQQQQQQQQQHHQLVRMQSVLKKQSSNSAPTTSTTNSSSSGSTSKYLANSKTSDLREKIMQELAAGQIRADPTRQPGGGAWSDAGGSRRDPGASSSGT